MKLIKPSYQIIEPTGYTIDDIYKSIELAGRVSHKSEDKITEDSAKTFVDRIINWGHNSCLEFGTIYLHINYHDPAFNKIIEKYITNEYSKCIILEKEAFITASYRIIIENNWLADLKYLCEPTKYHHKRYTVKFILDRGILAEFTRHRKFSFMAESTRYCNYSKDKFDNEITYILPPWIRETDVRNFYENSKGDNFLKYNEDSLGGSFSFLFNLEELEETYITLIKEEGWKPEQARNILPLALKTELDMCGFAEDWEHFFKLRCGTNAHPQARELAIPLKEEFIKRGYIIE